MMKHITCVNDEIKIRILDFLYEDELFNVFLIHYIENQIEDIGELYIEESNSSIDSILHMKFDGNSYFTSFFTTKEKGYCEIVKQIQALNYDKVLLSGKRKDVTKLLYYLGKEASSDADIYYSFDVNKVYIPAVNPDITFRMASSNEKDLNIISEFMMGFFEPTNEQEIADITNKNKLLEDIKIGVYFLENNGQRIGMARYCGKTKHYIDITTVYVKPDFRGKGYGKRLMEYMVMNIISENKLPVTQASKSNLIARKTYEDIGFIRADDYLFEFIS